MSPPAFSRPVTALQHHFKSAFSCQSTDVVVFRQTPRDLPNPLSECGGVGQVELAAASSQGARADFRGVVTSLTSCILESGPSPGYFPLDPVLASI